ncbi:MAG: hypothetical protein E6J78_08250 [Deltaproteobacteria bacterium]|nr:MAG: hypothetical protein E6J78_08250 [Deltaproteobacteria bacterium]
MKWFLLALVVSSAAWARTPKHPALDPTRWFALRAGLVRIYEGRAPSAGKDMPRAGASCEVLEAKPRERSVKESCVTIVARQARPATQITYQLRKDGIWSAAAEGQKERLVLPAPLRVGSSWREAREAAQLDRTVRSAGGACKAAGRSFVDCLVLSVTQRQGKKVLRRYTETYAAGVGLVEDAQWQLIDVKGL